MERRIFCRDDGFYEVQTYRNMGLLFSERFPKMRWDCDEDIEPVFRNLEDARKHKEWLEAMDARQKGVIE